MANVARRRARLPEQILHMLLKLAPPVRSFKEALTGSPGPAVIAEVKRASPSRGVLRPDMPWNPVGLAMAYKLGGARCLSVLTDTPYFWGSDDALGACRDATELPVLRKDFMLDPYQILESRWLGADCVLLIARILEPALLRTLSELALGLGMDVLVEVHDEAELDIALSVPDAIIGINNRNLDTLEIDVNRALGFKSYIPDNRVVVAESGISSAQVVQRYIEAGVNSFLIGEYLACHAHPAKALEELIT